MRCIPSLEKVGTMSPHISTPLHPQVDNCVIRTGFYPPWLFPLYQQILYGSYKVCLALLVCQTEVSEVICNENMLFFALKTSSVTLKCGSLRTVANKVTLPRCILNTVPSLTPPLRLDAQTSVHVCGSDAVLDSLSFQITAPCCIKHKSILICYNIFRPRTRDLRNYKECSAGVITTPCHHHSINYYYCYSYYLYYYIQSNITAKKNCCRTLTARWSGIAVAH